MIGAVTGVIATPPAALTSRRMVAAACALALVLRVPYLDDPLYPDEGGYLLVAERWSSGGPHVYGELWVDRPPLLLAFFRLAAELGGPVALRLLACVAVAGLVLAAGWVGRLLAGSRGSAWAAFTAAGLSASPLVAGQAADGELLTAPLVLLACAAVLAAVARCPGRSSLAFGAFSGLAGGGAMLVKQNVVDGVVFAAVLVLGYAITRRMAVRDAVRLLAVIVAGSLVPLVALLVWAQAFTPGVDVTYSELYGFRSEALAVILSWNLDPPLARAGQLLPLALITGIAPVLVGLGWVHARHRPSGASPPCAVALWVMVATAVTSTVLGASFWSQYLLGFLPVVVIASGALAVTATRARRALVGLLVAAGAMAAVTGAVVHQATGYPSADIAAVSAWLRESAAPDDTVVVSYGQPQVIRMAGLDPAYPYLWSLAVRTYDPDLDLLTRTLRGPAAPDWVVEVHDLGWWGLDSDGRFRSALAERYRQVATVCGFAVLQRADLARDVAWPGTGCPD